MLNVWGTLGTILALEMVVLFGFAYLIWIFAAKENMVSKVIGQIIAVVIVILSLVVVFGVSSNVSKAKHMMGKRSCPMMGRGMMQDGMKGSMPMMGKMGMPGEKMMKREQIKKEMHKMGIEKGKKPHKK